MDVAQRWSRTGREWHSSADELTRGAQAMLPTPGFHHMHVNSTDPDAAIDWYVKQFPSTSKGEWAGHKALKSPNDVLVLFTKVDAPPPTLVNSTSTSFGDLSAARRSSC